MTDLVNAWDPVGLIEAGAPRDEYDDIVNFTLRSLEAGTEPDALARGLAEYIYARYDCGPSDPKPFAARAVQWYRSRWSDSFV